MAASEHIIYQPYSPGKRGNLVPGKPVPCRTPEEAIRRAEKALAAGSVAGAHVVRVLGHLASVLGWYARGNRKYLESERLSGLS